MYTRLSADPAGPGGRIRTIVLQKLEKYVQPSQIVPHGELQLRLKVDDPDKIDTKEWADWITSAPRGVCSVQLELKKEPEIDQSSTWECHCKNEGNRLDLIVPD